MKILKTTDTSLKVIPRSYPDTVDLTIRNEGTNESTTLIDIAVTNSLGYLDIPFTYTFTEGSNYDFEVSSAGERIYKGKIFCTDQEIESYSMNKNRYEERTVQRNYIQR